MEEREEFPSHRYGSEYWHLGKYMENLMVMLSTEAVNSNFPLMTSRTQSILIISKMILCFKIIPNQSSGEVSKIKTYYSLKGQEE